MSPGSIRSSEKLGLDDSSDVTAAALFAIVWDTLAEVLGTAAVAAIVRRAVGRAAVECPELVDLVISREDLEHHYRLPQAWQKKAERGPVALRILVAEIGRLLVELTGSVVIRRLEQVPELRAYGLIFSAEDAN